jgi:adenylate cyclase
MGKEIERKFLVDHEKWHQLEKPIGHLYRQGYLVAEPNKTIRVRQTDTHGFLTIKGKSSGATRSEYEYEIPIEEARELLDNFSDTELSKVRYKIIYSGKLWEVDVFSGANDGLIVAEIELNSEDEAFDIPPWITHEVTDDVRYYNSTLTKKPFTDW